MQCAITPCRPLRPAPAAGRSQRRIHPLSRWIARDFALGYARQVLKHLGMHEPQENLTMPMTAQALTLYHLPIAEGKTESRWLGHPYPLSRAQRISFLRLRVHGDGLRQIQLGPPIRKRPELRTFGVESGEAVGPVVPVVCIALI